MAAGKGTRMGGNLPKVLYPVCGWPMIQHVANELDSLGLETMLPVVGFGREQVQTSFASFQHRLKCKNIAFVEQAQQLGTADAVKVCLPLLAQKEEAVIITNGDAPLLRAQDFQLLLERHHHERAAITVGCMLPANATGYGRVVGDVNNVQAIVEEKDATTEQKNIPLCNGGVYVVTASVLHRLIPQVQPSPVTQELYLPDIIGLAVAANVKVVAALLPESALLGVNNPTQLAVAEKQMQANIVEEWQAKRVQFQDPQATYLDKTICLGEGAFIGAGCTIQLESTVGENTRVEQGCVLRESQVAAEAHIKAYSYLEKAKVGKQSSVGPFAHLRPGANLGASVKVGNFVEIKNANLADEAKVSHLSYVGDAEIGKNVNLGCGFVACNYDGVRKHQTVIKDNVFVGSGVQAVAPITIEHDAYVATGSTVTEDVPAYAMVIARVRQVVKENYAKKIWQKLKGQKK